MIKQQPNQGFVRYSRRTSQRILSRLAVVILAFIPPAILVANVAAYHVDVPFWDQWNFVPLLGQSYEQGISLKDLWGQHNEHRLLFPRIIMLGLAHVSRYNIAWELVIILLLAAAIFALLCSQMSRTAGALGARGFPLAVPAISLLVFTLGQAENWLWGWQIQIFLNVFAVAAGFILIGGRPFRWSRYGCVLGCGVLATYSFANGLLYWPLGFLGICLIPLKSRRQKVGALTLWTAAMIGVAVSYLYKFSYGSPPGTPWTRFLDHPGEYLRYVFIYLGRPVINYQEFSLALGVAGFFLFGFLMIYLFRKKRGNLTAFLPFFLLGLYACGCGLLTGIGRVWLGSAQATSGRYVPFSALIWISNFAFLFILFQDIRVKARTHSRKFIGLTCVGVLAFFLVFWIGRTSYRVGYRVFKSHHTRLLPARQELLRGENKELLLRLYIDADYVLRGAEILRRHNLSVFR